MFSRLKKKRRKKPGMLHKWRQARSTEEGRFRIFHEVSCLIVESQIIWCIKYVSWKRIDFLSNHSPPLCLRMKSMFYSHSWQPNTKKRFTIVDSRFVTDFNLSVCRSPARRVIKQRAPDIRKRNNSWELTNKSSTKQRRTKFEAARKPQCSHFLLDVTVET